MYGITPDEPLDGVRIWSSGGADLELASTLAWVERTVGPVMAVEPMPEASHTNHRLVLESGAMLVLRRYTDEELRDGDPWYVPADEIAALRALEAVEGVPVPHLVAADPDAVECDVSTLLLTWLPGSRPGRPDDLDAFVRGLAEPLPAIHAAPLVGRAYEPYLISDGERFEDLRPPAWATDPRVWERAFVAATAEQPPAPRRFIHRDFHQGNTLWEGDALTGVIDWTTGCSGPAGIDVAQMRINLAWEFDLETADAFLDVWRALEPGDEHDPFWDLLDAADWLGDGSPNEPVPPGGLERYEAFVARTLSELG
jgi:Ser/Thr protein kinase RdoA (MazF antagonist)